MKPFVNHLLTSCGEQIELGGGHVGASLDVGLGRAACADVASDGLRGAGKLGTGATVQIRAGRFPGGLDLLGCSDVGLGKFNVFFRARHLALVPLG